MSRHLPDRINPYYLASIGAELVGELDAVRLERLQQAVDGVVGSVPVTLSFSKNDFNASVITGAISAEVTVKCERCLEPMQVVLRSTPALMVLESEQLADQLAGDWEPLIVGDEPISLVDLVEDELLMQLPDFPKHGTGDCAAAGEQQGDIVKERDTPERNYPFAGLKQQMNSGD